MAGSKVFQFFLLISLMILSTHALEVYLTEGKDKSGFDYRTKINVGIDGNGLKYFNGCTEKEIFVADRDTKKVVVYIRSQADYDREIPDYGTERNNLRISLRSNYHCELLNLIVTGFTPGDERVISEFLQQSIKPHRRQNNFQTYTIGEGNLNKNYKTLLGEFDTYREDENVFQGKMHEAIRAAYPR